MDSNIAQIKEKTWKNESAERNEVMSVETRLAENFWIRFLVFHTELFTDEIPEKVKTHHFEYID